MNKGPYQPYNSAMHVANNMDVVQSYVFSVLSSFQFKPLNMALKTIIHGVFMTEFLHQKNYVDNQL